MNLPRNFRELSYLLDKERNFNNILIVNTTKTGPFLDRMFVEKRTTRIKCSIDDNNALAETLQQLNTTFELICLDPYHEYEQSNKYLSTAASFLAEDGILICHDCSPPNVKCTSRRFIKGEWCGVTYASFVEFAYNNPTMFYAVINRDYGLGIVTKKEMQYVRKIDSNEKQRRFLELFKNSDEEAYAYFRTHAHEMVNLIN